MGCAVIGRVQGGLLLARRDIQATAAVDAAFGLFDVMHFAVGIFSAGHVQIVAGDQGDIAGADDLRTLRMDVMAGLHLHAVTAQGRGDGEAVVACVMRGGAFGVEHPLLFLGHVLREVMLLLNAEQIDIAPGADRHAAVLALDAGCAQIRIAVGVQGNPAAGLKIRAMHRFIAGLSGLFKAFARCKGMTRIGRGQCRGIQVMPSRHPDALPGLQLRSGQVEIVTGLQLKIAARLQGLRLDALRSRGRRDLRLALLDLPGKSGELLLEMKTDRRVRIETAKIYRRVQARSGSNFNNEWSKYFIGGQ